MGIRIPDSMSQEPLVSNVEPRKDLQDEKRFKRKKICAIIQCSGNRREETPAPWEPEYGRRVLQLPIFWSHIPSRAIVSDA